MALLDVAPSTLTQLDGANLRQAAILTSAEMHISYRKYSSIGLPNLVKIS